MNTRQIESLQASWNHAKPIADTVVRLFYRRLFELAPDTRQRFHMSMSEQGDHLLAAADYLIDNLNNETPINEVPAEVDSFAEYENAVVDAWLWALEQEIGRWASQGACEAWQEAIQTDAGTIFKMVALGEVAVVAG